MEQAFGRGKQFLAWFLDIMSEIFSELCFDAWTLVGNPWKDPAVSRSSASDSDRNSEARNLFLFRGEEEVKLGAVDRGFVHLMLVCELLGFVGRKSVVSSSSSVAVPEFASAAVASEFASAAAGGVSDFSSAAAMAAAG